MRQTKERESSCRLAVDIEGLAAMLSCGQMKVVQVRPSHVRLFYSRLSKQKFLTH